MLGMKRIAISMLVHGNHTKLYNIHTHKIKQIEPNLK